MCSQGETGPTGGPRRPAVPPVSTCRRLSPGPTCPTPVPLAQPLLCPRLCFCSAAPEHQPERAPPPLTGSASNRRLQQQSGPSHSSTQLEHSEVNSGKPSPAPAGRSVRPCPGGTVTVCFLPRSAPRLPEGSRPGSAHTRHQ